MKEQDSTSTARIMPTRKVSEPVYIKLEELEAFREIESATYKQVAPSTHQVFKK